MANYSMMIYLLLLTTFCAVSIDQSLSTKKFKSLNSISTASSSEIHSKRPLQPSHQLPVIDIEESPDKIYDPKIKDIDSRYLLEILGENYDKGFVSNIRPLESAFNFLNSSLNTGYKKNHRGQMVPMGKMPENIKKLKFKNWLILKNSPNSRFKLETGLSPKTRRTMRQFLWSYTYCPVKFVWKDMGIRFFPRWLRHGYCDSRHSCSFPRGMSCKASKSEDKALLRWHCQDYDKASYCKWLLVWVPIVIACDCSC